MIKKILQVLFFILVSIPALANSDTGIITIPVVVHILYNTSQQNISDAQVISQLNVLNKDYRGTNVDKINIPSYFAALAGDGGFEFRLAIIDPSGYSTTGIIRKKTNIQMFGLDDRVKSSAIGGDDPWNKDNYLNIWVCNLAGGILGYTSPVTGAAAKDGVVIQYSVFGTTGVVNAPFNLGRTVTHEIGHWLNLKHIWGDAYCGDDEVDDTPRQRTSNRGRPTGQKFTCDSSGHGDMYMNFMDLTDDAGMFLFTQGQCKRMRALFGVGGRRHAMLFSNAVTGIALPPLIQIKPPAVISKLVTVFPNPAQSLITVELDSNLNGKVKAVNIFNNVGQLVITKTMMGNLVTININQLKAGLYFIRVLNGDSKVATTFVKD